MNYAEKIEKEINALQVRRTELVELLLNGGHEYERKFLEISSQIHAIDQSINTKRNWVRYKGKCPIELTKDVIIPIQ